MKWEPDDFVLEKSSVWSFPERGNWATHDSKYRGNCSPYVVRNLLLRYSKEGDWILDQFAGGGTSLVEAKLLGRNAIGADINPKAVDRCKEKIAFKYGDAKIEVREADARKLNFVKDASVDFICTHPPYVDIIKYSDGIEGDFSLLDYTSFLNAMEQAAEETFRILKKGNYFAFIIGDIRQNGSVRPLGFDTMKIFEKAGFKLKEIIIKQQHNCKMTDKWEKISIDKNFFLLAHEYVFILKKIERYTKDKWKSNLVF